MRKFSRPLILPSSFRASRLNLNVRRTYGRVVDHNSEPQAKTDSFSFPAHFPRSESVTWDAISSAYAMPKREKYWQSVAVWKEVTEEEFLDYRWQVSNTVQGKDKLHDFLHAVLPLHIPTALTNNTDNTTRNATISREDFISDVMSGIELAPMSIRLTPHILSVVDWSNALTDPIRRQFIPLKSSLLPDHPKLSLDSLHETKDSPVPGLVHRYHDKALFLATSVCPVYCRFCTRSYSVGATTASVASKKSFAPARRRWEKMFDCIASTPSLVDIVVSGGDSYYLQPEHITEIGHRLLSIPHIRRFRFATKGLAVSPMRILTDDAWTNALLEVSDQGKKMGKAVAVHTHFNHPKEITWVTKVAAQKLFERGVMVRNQTVLLKGVNDDVETMKELIRGLADINIQPYYVYQTDMVRGVEDLRTPLSTILHLEQQIRGTIAGFMTPNFVVDLPGGGGKRLAASYESYDKTTGVSTFAAPGVKGSDEVFEYWDPLWSVGRKDDSAVLSCDALS